VRLPIPDKKIEIKEEYIPNLKHILMQKMKKETEDKQKNNQ
jgi:hypothetical protein